MAPSNLAPVTPRLLCFSSGGVVIDSRMDRTGLGVRLAQSSIGYTGCGWYAVEEESRLRLCGLERGRDAGSGASNMTEGGMDRR